MEITITETAIEKINTRLKDQSGYLKLKYDIEGCGCAVSGVAALWLEPELDSVDIEIKTNNRPIYIDKAKTVFFDEKMTIDFSETANSLQLKSPNQILNGRMSLVIKGTD